MKQPDLGKKLAEFRNEIGLTQEQLSEKTKINIRTIQRIESGEVTPRTYTLKIILEILGRNFDEINGEKPQYVVEKPGILKMAFIFGIALAINNIIFTSLVFLRDLYGVQHAIHFISLTLLLSILFTFFFNRGIIYVGKTFNNSYLIITGYLGVILAVICNFSYIARYYSPDFNMALISKGLLILSAINGIFYGVGLLLMKRYLNDLALIAGILLIFGSVLLIVPVGIVELVGVIMSVPTLLVQVILFYRLQTMQLSVEARS